ncbi:TetR/AcrR family transcriptional regulator [Mycolicibacterium monacense]|uniref:TetR/AcrR family transcriptional regulator n=1 Tax=Mycolicibacterium monacense TaxID=85693 RepID=UPI0007EA2AE1|nr:TetR/AcrR family transcriptional regulator [Mycolicibacterium monacense]OBF51145.1 TetR family transcriptional regulator [Mycolicibacterium monacense]
MRTHGWSGATPANDDEAVARILEAAKRRIDRHGKDFGISDVAKDVGVTRQTVYRYFPSTEALLYATSLTEVEPFLDNLAKHLRRIHDPAEAVIEALAHTLERLPHERYLGLLMTSGKASAFSAGVTSDVALSFGRTMVERFAVDWAAAGYGEDRDLDSLVEYMLRILQSLVIDPGRPPHRGKELRAFLRRWVSPAIASHAATQSARRPARRATAKATARREVVNSRDHPQSMA